MLKNTFRKSIHIFFCILILATILGLSLYNYAMKKMLSQTSCQTIQELMGQEKLTFLSHLEGEINVVTTIAQLITNMEGIANNHLLAVKFLQDAATTSRFDYMILADLSGQGVTSYDKRIDVSHRTYFQEALKGQVSVSDPIISQVDGKTVVVVAVPVIKNGQIGAVLAGAYVTSSLNDLFFASFEGEGRAYICDADGYVITRASRQKNGVKSNVLEYLQESEPVEYDNYDTILANMQAGISGHSIYRFNGQKRLLHYAPLDFNGWYIFTSVPDDVVAAQANYLLFLTVILTACIALLFFGLVIYLILSERKYAELLYKKAYYSDLTDCPNMTKFREEGSLLLADNPQRPYAAMRLNIEGLDFLNEIFSYVVGDQLIRGAAQSLKALCNPKTECFAHIYGDRFIALLNCENFEQMEARQAEFERMFNEKIKGLMTYKVKFAVGLYLVEQGETDILAVIEKVSFAHNTAKKNELLENKTQKYDSKLRDKLNLEREVEAKMEKALADEEFTMFLQPKYALADNTLVGAEALARWWIKGQYIMYPADFIPIFEKNGFVVQLDMYMFEQACKYLKSLIDAGKKPFIISTNFSRLHLLKGGFVSCLCAIADQYGVPHEYLETEITESSMVGNEAVLKAVLAELHEAGFTLSMDDFGTGYSSLGLLKEIPIDVVKIDRSFFEKSKEAKREQIVITSVIQMAKKLDIHTVAEGVETKAHIDLLREIGCEIVQGYYFAKPMPFHEFTERFVE